MTTYTISPLDYIEAGEQLRSAEEFMLPTDSDTLYLAFLEYCRWMREKFVKLEMYSKRGDDISQQVSTPMQPETFWLFAGLKRAEWESLASDPITSPICILIEDAINAQQIEGALFGKYMAKIVTILQGRKEQLELSGSLRVEQITGMEVL